MRRMHWRSSWERWSWSLHRPNCSLWKPSAKFRYVESTWITLTSCSAQDYSESYKKQLFQVQQGGHLNVMLSPKLFWITQKIVPKGSTYLHACVSELSEQKTVLKRRGWFCVCLSISCCFSSLNVFSPQCLGDCKGSAGLQGLCADVSLLINEVLINSDYSAFLGAGAPERSPYEWNPSCQKLLV